MPHGDEEDPSSIRIDLVNEPSDHHSMNVNELLRESSKQEGRKVKDHSLCLNLIESIADRHDEQTRLSGDLQE